MLHPMPALLALGADEVAAATEAFLGRLWSSAVPVSTEAVRVAAAGGSGGLKGPSSKGVMLQLQEGALRDWTQELVGGVLGRCDAALSAEREGAATREAALVGALSRAHAASADACLDLTRTRADVDVAIAAGVADRGAALVFAHGRVARALVCERAAAATTQRRAIQDAKEEVTLELERREAEITTLRANTVLHKIDLRQKALHTLAGVRSEARVKMLGLMEDATRGASGGSFRPDKLTRIGDLEDAVSALQIDNGELEATLAKLQTVFKLRTASRKSAAARETRDRTAGALEAEGVAVIAREAAEARLGIASRQLAATQAALGEYRARLSRAEGDLDHVARNKTRLQRERVKTARENAGLREQVADLERRRMLASSGIGQGQAAAAGLGGNGVRDSFGAVSTSGTGGVATGWSESGGGRPSTAGGAPRSAAAFGAGRHHTGEGETASRRIADLEREVDVLRAEAAVAATAAEGIHKPSLSRGWAAAPALTPRHAAGAEGVTSEAISSSRPRSPASPRGFGGYPVTAPANSGGGNGGGGRRRPTSAQHLTQAAIGAQANEVQSAVWRTRYEKLAQRHDALEAEADHMSATLASIEGLFGAEAAAVLASEAAAAAATAVGRSGGSFNGMGLSGDGARRRPVTGRAASPRVDGAVRPESAPVRRPYVPRASRLTPATPASPAAKAKHRQEQKLPLALGVNVQPRVFTRTTEDSITTSTVSGRP
jgi:hypothetical protein